MHFNKQFLLNTLPDALVLYDNFPLSVSFSIDTRTLSEGDIFIALSGSRCDGHDFVKNAFEKGAAGCIIAADKKDLIASLADVVKNKLVILVPDTLNALLSLACAWRNQFQGTVVAVTGSVGKTSTKEMLSQIFTVCGVLHIASYDNQNTRIGVALNLLRLQKEHAFAVIEVGISERGEMAELAKMVRPDNALITSVAHQHMDGLGLLHDIAIEKRDIFKYFREDNIGIINGDIPEIANVSYLHPVVKFGLKTTNQIQARKIQVKDSCVHFVLKMYGKRYNIMLKNAHMGMVNNVIAAAAVAQLLGVDHDSIVKAIQIPLVVKGRFEERLMRCGGILIDDCYNANPESTKSALLALHHTKKRNRKVAVIGDMLGLGINSPFWHRQIGRFLRKITSVRELILVGNAVSWIKKTAPIGIAIRHVDTWQGALDLLEKEINKDDLVLVKGSRDVGLDNIVDALT